MTALDIPEERRCQLCPTGSPPALALLRVRLVWISQHGGGTTERDACLSCRDDKKREFAESGDTLKVVERIRQ